MAKYNRIKDLREDSDMTQQEIAEYLGRPPSIMGSTSLVTRKFPLSAPLLLQNFTA